MLIVLIKSVFFFVFFKTGFVINKKPPLIQEQSGMIRLRSSATFAGEHFGRGRSTFRSHSFLIDVCFILFCKCLSKKCCLSKVIFSVTVAKIQHYIQHGFNSSTSCKNHDHQTIELLYYQECFTMWRCCQYVFRGLIEVQQQVFLSLQT